ncbi:acyl-CoA dehydrogenase family protein [Streptomyces sp. LX-29]|uniref:acyl-CoA dehydrogenase family protein n=1 Tax=Streptomyces sp. LX-29 TaxID=2900152 RepID=UPI00240CF63F|nr:acyl-CoA dehydrogenase family protein [Streptomyces sp. LX-29]WFB11175.1 acyl-CoA dehydrogenase family protein [Streptomyces sp. LX-29]
MDFDWSAEQHDLYTSVLAGARTAFPEDTARADTAYTRAQWSRLAPLGLLGASVPEDRGGRGLGALDSALAFEAAGRGCVNTGILFAAAAHLFSCAMPILEFATPGTCRRLLPDMCSGALIAGNAMTEPDSGSDVSRLAVTARRVADGFLLSGTKSFVSNGPTADLYVTYATTDPRAGHLGITAFVVDRAAPGVAAGEPLDKMGLLSCPAGPVTFDRCFVPDEQVLGVPGQGGAIFQHSMRWERSCLFAVYLGVQQRLLDRCVEHVRRRRQSGRPLAEFQSVANRVVDMKLRLESGRLLLYRACDALDRDDQDAALWVSLSKLAVSEAAVASALDAVQLLGGRGYLRDEGIEAALRDAVPTTIFSGTSEIQRQLIARAMGL